MFDTIAYDFDAAVRVGSFANFLSESSNLAEVSVAYLVSPLGLTRVSFLIFLITDCYLISITCCLTFLSTATRSLSSKLSILKRSSI